MRKTSKRCKRCMYSTRLTGTGHADTACIYILFPGHTARQLICPAGESCTVFEAGSNFRALEKAIMAQKNRGVVNMAKNKTDINNERRRLWEAGATDARIAEMQGVSASEVAAWRKMRGMSPNKEADTTVCEQAEAPERDERLEQARAAGLPVSTTPYDSDEPDDPYVYDGGMTPEDYEKAQEMRTQDKPSPEAKTDANKLLSDDYEDERQKCESAINLPPETLTVGALRRLLDELPDSATITCAECGEAIQWALVRKEYDHSAQLVSAELMLGYDA